MGCSCSRYEKQAEVKLEVPDPYTELIQKQAHEYPILLYSSAGCAKCQQLKQLLRQYTKNFEYFELEYMSNFYIDDGNSLLQALGHYTGQICPPYLFIRGKFVGGLTEFQEFQKEGRLTEVKRDLASNYITV